MKSNLHFTASSYTIVDRVMRYLMAEGLPLSAFTGGIWRGKPFLDAVGVDYSPAREKVFRRVAHNNSLTITIL